LYLWYFPDQFIPCSQIGERGVGISNIVVLA